MRNNIIARDIGKKFPISELPGIQYQARLLSRGSTREVFAAKKQPELKRHVEAWQASINIETRARDIVNAKIAFADYFVNFLHAQLASIVRVRVSKVKISWFSFFRGKL
ncbi:MAG TPA: hypothetical protein VM120_01880, partial [Bryobacteraceae bacterium]|nr:hypothetical protein [Bryobacteraceae bacterium]